MTWRSAAVPDLLERFARECDGNLQELEATFPVLFSSHEQFRVRCTPAIDDLPTLSNLTSRLRDIDEFARKVGSDFLRADLRSLLSGGTSPEWYLEDRHRFDLSDVDPFGDVRFDRDAAALAGATGCFGPSLGTAGFVMTGPDGLTYFVAAADGDQGWTNISVADGVVIQDTTTASDMFAYGVIGYDPLGSPASEEWYEQHAFASADGSLQLTAEPVAGYRSTDTPDDGVFASALAGGVDVAVAGASAATRSTGGDDGYYVVQFQHNEQGHRRAVVTVYQVRDGGVITMTGNDPTQIVNAKRKPRRRQPVTPKPVFE